MNMVPGEQQVENAYALAKERYAALGVDTDAALKILQTVPISLQCWQGDDVAGFENTGEGLSGGIAVTGNYPGKARTADELRKDLDQTYAMIPGSHRLSLHAIYAETGSQVVDRAKLGPEHFSAWIDWAKANRHGLDYNPTLFSHPMAASGFTLSSYDETVRAYWIEHCIGSRKIGAAFGAALGTPCVTNIWIPDGFKDVPMDRKTPRALLVQALDEVLAEKIDPRHNLDAVEGKLFGIGAESYTTGSNDFYLAYAVARQCLLCLDAGHFHPTETIADKISSALFFVPELLLHVSRSVRWDSDHVVTLTDDLQLITQEIVRGGFLNRVHIGLDFFDASINRVAAWTIGTRNTVKAVMMALLEPAAALREFEVSGDYTSRLAFLEELKSMPMGAVWDHYCQSQGAPVGLSYLAQIKEYEKNVLSKRA